MGQEGKGNGKKKGKGLLSEGRKVGDLNKVGRCCGERQTCLMEKKVGEIGDI